MKHALMQSESTRPLAERAVTRTGSSPRPEPSHDEIARRAYAIYERSGRQPGQSLENWLLAELELQEEAWNGSATTPARDGSHR